MHHWLVSGVVFNFPLPGLKLSFGLFFEKDHHDPADLRPCSFNQDTDKKGTSMSINLIFYYLNTREIALKSFAGTNGLMIHPVAPACLASIFFAV